MPEEKNTYVSDAFSLQEAARQPHSRRGGGHIVAGQGLAVPQSETLQKDQLLPRDLILRLIQTLKSK